MTYNFSIQRFTNKIILLLILIGTSTVFAQTTVPKQSDRLQQYLGFWVSSIDHTTDSIGKTPLIKMNNYPKIDNTAMSVDVFQKDGKTYNHT